ncbi:MAG: DUF2939 domain-containing protein [Lysobacter sp.]|nr:DUF2939 domain-containing protein [Lysobacter sp.]
MNRIARLAIVALGVAFCVWMYFAPHLTVRSMRLAAERGDAEALAAHIDFPALRESVKRQLADAMGERIGGSDGADAFGELGARLATAIADPMIDAMLSPQALSMMFTGGGLALDGLATAGIRNADGNRESSRHLPQWQAEMRYEDFNTFAVRLHPDDDAIPPSTLIFKREKLLLWKLSGIEMAAF